MSYVLIDSKKYITGIQTSMDCFMPEQLSAKNIDAKMNTTIVDELGDFFYALDNVRNKVRAMSYTSIQELKGYVSASVDMLGTLPCFSSGATPLSLAVQREVRTLEPESIVVATERINYASHKVPVETMGKILRVNPAGNAIVQW